VIFTVTGGPDLTLYEVQEAANVVYSSVSDDANIIFGSVIDERLHGEVLITVIATGFDLVAQNMTPPPRPAAQRTPTPSLQSPVPVAAGRSEKSTNEFKKLASDILDIPEFLRARQGK
jgi:cell division protein FtsZ